MGNTIPEVYTNQVNVDVNGNLQNWIPATPCVMMCERRGCTSKSGNEYVRLEPEKSRGWENEPIFLCSEHSKNHHLFGVAETVPKPKTSFWNLFKKFF